MQPGYTDELRELPARYWSTGDLPDFMEQASPFIMRYCRRRLSKDDDLIGDFYVHFYERAPGCLEHYKSRQDIPFTGYLATYLRHEFLNYAKTSRNARYSETPTAEFFGRERSMFSFSGADEQPDAPELPPDDSVDRLLEPLPLHVRLPIKLYHGLELNFEELHEIASVHETPIAAAQFVTEYRTRRLRLS